MSAFFTLPRQIPLSAGVILPGAKLTFSQTGTSTLQNTYADSARTTPNANPVVADANGVFQAIYLDPTLPDYRVKLTTSANVLIYQEDGVPSNQNTQQSMRLESTSPFLFFYDTDGVPNERKFRVIAIADTLYFQQVNDAESVFTTLFSATGGVVNLPVTATVSGQLIPSYQSGSFTGTLTGFTTTVTGMITWYRIGSFVHLSAISGITGTSNTTAMTMTGIPIGIQASHISNSDCTVEDNSNIDMAAVGSILGTTLTFKLAKTNGVANFVQYSSTNFTNAGTKGITAGWSYTYFLD